MTEEKILTFVKNVKDIVFEKEISTKLVIIDFFNVYCNIIKFNKYKTFSRETFIICIELLIKKLKNYKTIIVSKNIFEIEQEYIRKIVFENTNITYIIVEDTYSRKSMNRERDDYICILLQKYFLKIKKTESCIVTNDKYKNYFSLLKNMKPCKLKIFTKNNLINIDINHSLINSFNYNLKYCETYVSQFVLI